MECESMKYEKTLINRAVQEINECLINILNTDRSQYALRIRQLFKKIADNEILNFIIKPYLSLKMLEKDNFGIMNDGDIYSYTFAIPEDEDEEIALILEVLRNMADDEKTITSWPSALYKKSREENLNLFNRNIIGPAFIKLQRKLQHKLEDISKLNKERIEADNITIINISGLTATNSMIAIGKEISQQNVNVFEEIKKI